MAIERQLEGILIGNPHWIFLPRPRIRMYLTPASCVNASLAMKLYSGI